MNERSFVKFFTALGVSLFLLGNVSNFALGHYTNRLVAGELLPVTVCEKNSDEAYTLSQEPAYIICARAAEWTELLSADCGAVEEEDKQNVCMNLKAVLQERIDACNDPATYEPLPTAKLTGLCNALGL